MPDKIIRIVLISNSMLFLEGLRKILADEDEIGIIGECSRLKELKSMVRELGPEALFIDNRELKWDIEKLFQGGKFGKNNVRVIQFSDGAAEESANPRLVTVNQETTASELIAIIKNAKDNAVAKEDPTSHDSMVQRLTKTEVSVIKLIASGQSNKHISEKLSISEKTVKAHISNIFLKLNMKNRYQLMVFGKRNKKNPETSF